MSAIRKARWRRRVLAGGLLAAAAVITSCAVWPDVSRLKTQTPRLTAFMKYRRAEAEKKGQPLTIRYQWVPLRSISPNLRRAVVIAEDDKFWQHGGFDFGAMKDAVKRDFARKSVRFGGSTITQQLAKNLFLSPSRSPIRKLREFILAWRLERALSKERILELYLNAVEWGNGIFGAEAAARHYYGKPAADLTAGEAARLAVVLPSPRRYNPVGGTEFIEERARQVLEVMDKRGFLD